MKTTFNFEIPIKDYSNNIILMVADILSNEYFVTINKKSKNYIFQIKPKFDKSINRIELKDILQDHLNSQVIRAKIVKETGKIREMIVSLALYSTEAFDDESSDFNVNDFKDEDNYLLDQRGICKTF